MQEVDVTHINCYRSLLRSLVIPVTKTAVLVNYFQPTRKRLAKETDLATGKHSKTYFEAMTPYQRVMAHPTTSQATKDMLTAEYDQLNPVKLLAAIQVLLAELKRGLW